MQVGHYHAPKPVRLIDYLLVVGVDESNKVGVAENPTQFGVDAASHATTKGMKMDDEGAVEGRVLNRYPKHSHLDSPWPAAVPLFCLPQGIHTQPCSHQTDDQHTQREEFTTYAFVLTDGHGVRTYGTCLSYFEQSGNDNKQYERVLCVLSHWPMYRLFAQALQVLWAGSAAAKTLSWSNNAEALETLQGDIANFMYCLVSQDGIGVPLPSMCVRLAPPASLRCTLEKPFLFAVRPPLTALTFTSDSCMRALFESLSPSNVISVMSGMLMEQRILLHSTNISKLTAVAEALHGLFYPFHWPHVYIPLLPFHLLGYLDSPMPFIIGIHTDCLATPEGLESLSSTILVHLDSDKVVTPIDVSLPKVKNATLSNSKENDFLPELPSVVRNKLLARLEESMRFKSITELQKQSSNVFSETIMKNEIVITDNCNTETKEDKQVYDSKRVQQARRYSPPPAPPETPPPIPPATHVPNAKATSSNDSTSRGKGSSSPLSRFRVWSTGSTKSDTSMQENSNTSSPRNTSTNTSTFLESPRHPSSVANRRNRQGSGGRESRGESSNSEYSVSSGVSNLSRFSRRRGSSTETGSLSASGDTPVSEPEKWELTRMLLQSLPVSLVARLLLPLHRTGLKQGGQSAHSIHQTGAILLPTGVHGERDVLVDVPRGKLGILFEPWQGEDWDSSVVISEYEQGGTWAIQENIRNLLPRGSGLVSINEVPTVSLTFSQTIAALRIASRPIRLRFRLSQQDVLQHSVGAPTFATTEEPTPEEYGGYVWVDMVRTAFLEAMIELLQDFRAHVLCQTKRNEVATGSLSTHQLHCLQRLVAQHHNKGNQQAMKNLVQATSTIADNSMIMFEDMFDTLGYLNNCALDSQRFMHGIVGSQAFQQFVDECYHFETKFATDPFGEQVFDEDSIGFDLEIGSFIRCSETVRQSKFCSALVAPIVEDRPLPPSTNQPRPPQQATVDGYDDETFPEMEHGTWITLQRMVCREVLDFVEVQYPSKSATQAKQMQPTPLMSLLYTLIPVCDRQSTQHKQSEAENQSNPMGDPIPEKEVKCLKHKQLSVEVEESNFESMRNTPQKPETAPHQRAKALTSSPSRRRLNRRVSQLPVPGAHPVGFLSLQPNNGKEDRGMSNTSPSRSTGRRRSTVLLKDPRTIRTSSVASDTTDPGGFSSDEEEDTSKFIEPAVLITDGVPGFNATRRRGSSFRVMVSRKPTPKPVQIKNRSPTLHEDREEFDEIPSPDDIHVLVSSAQRVHRSSTITKRT